MDSVPNFKCAEILVVPEISGKSLVSLYLSKLLIAFKSFKASSLPPCFRQS